MPVVVATAVVVIPTMVVLHAAAFTLPISGEIAPSVISGRNPSRGRIRHAGPITAVPLIVVSNRIPITVDPIEIRAGADRTRTNHPQRWGRANGDSD
jgi:hypothetical protein